MSILILKCGLSDYPSCTDVVDEFCSITARQNQPKWVCQQTRLELVVISME